MFSLGDYLSKAICAFTIDVEAFAESHSQSVNVDRSYLDRPLMDREIEENLNVALQLLHDHAVQATFFFLGRIAQSSPHLVRQVAGCGHEIGCHSLEHIRISGQSRAEFRRDLITAKTALEDASGSDVIGFRAPDFSIGATNVWAFDELRESGFKYDSSAVPTSLHDVYGMGDVPEHIFVWPNGLIEFPLPVRHFLGLSVPLGGGGYFRLFPVAWTKNMFVRNCRRNIPSTFYIHPYEIGPKAPRLPGLSLSRRLRHYVRLDQGRERLTPLLKTIPFTTMSRVLTEAGFLPPASERS